MTDSMRIGPGISETCDAFIAELAAMDAPRVLEWGTRRADPDVATHHQEWCPGAAEYVMADFEPGLDVDLVADAHNLSPTGMKYCGHFDAVIAVAVYEHLARPALAAKTLAWSLAPGGIAFVSTHHTFPDHPAYGGDYTRWSRDGLEILFTDDAGLDVVQTGYMYPCRIVPQDTLIRWNDADDVEAWLVVDGFFRKPL